MSHGNGFLFKNGVALPAAETPSVAAFLQAHPGAYTTTRTHNNGSQLLFWERHMHRLSNSFKILLKENPKFLFEKPENVTAQFWELSNRTMMWDAVTRYLVDDSMRKVMPLVVKERKFGEELAITMLLSGNLQNLDHLEGNFDERRRISEALDVYLHVGGYVPSVFGVTGNAARLAVVGRGRDFANAKYSDWVRLRKHLEKLRPPSVTELLLSNDGEHILEGCVTNFFVVCLKDKEFEVQTAPIIDGVLPGITRQVIRELVSCGYKDYIFEGYHGAIVTNLKLCSICLKVGIPFREVAPSWSEREFWMEAFITSSLRILQHVETIQAPKSWKSVQSNTWEEITWVEKRFKDGPGMITSMLQREIMQKAGFEAIPVSSFDEPA